VWANFPLLVNSSVVVMGNGTQLANYSDQYSFWPTCFYSVGFTTLEYTVQPKTDESDAGITITTTSPYTYYDYCPEFSGVVDVYHNGLKIQAAAVSEDEMIA
jgi:hypothetical protein